MTVCNPCYRPTAAPESQGAVRQIDVGETPTVRLARASYNSSKRLAPAVPGACHREPARAGFSPGKSGASNQETSHGCKETSTQKGEDLGGHQAAATTAGGRSVAGRAAPGRDRAGAERAGAQPARPSSASAPRPAGWTPSRRFFTAMPADSGIAFVLVPHLDPAHKSLMVELLARHTAMPVVEAENRHAGRGQPRLHHPAQQVHDHPRAASCA